MRTQRREGPWRWRQAGTGSIAESAVALSECAPSGAREECSGRIRSRNYGCAEAARGVGGVGVESQSGE